MSLLRLLGLSGVRLVEILQPLEDSKISLWIWLMTSKTSFTSNRVISWILPNILGKHLRLKMTFPVRALFASVVAIGICATLPGIFRKRKMWKNPLGFLIVQENWSIILYIRLQTFRRISYRCVVNGVIGTIANTKIWRIKLFQTCCLIVFKLITNILKWFR